MRWAVIAAGSSPITQAQSGAWQPRASPDRRDSCFLRGVAKLICGAVLSLALLGARDARAQGGPPLITDDPDTPGPGYWEINLSTFLEEHPHSHRLELPRLDANYGVGPRIQLKFEVPWVRDSGDGLVRTGAGNAAAGVKYRFLGQEGRLFAWSVYPQLTLAAPRSSIDKGIADSGPAFFLPTEFTIENAHVEINGEVGRLFARDGNSAWEYGLSTEGHVVPRLELLAELHAEKGRSGSEIIANAGARPKLTRQIVLLLAAGRGFHGPEGEHTRFLCYAGLQFNLPGLYVPTDLQQTGAR